MENMEKVIVSFTSYPKRIGTIYKVLDSIISQTVLPDKIVLYLSSSEFKDFGKLPNFEKYEKYGFEIHWYEENLKSHKKWFYAFQEYRNDIVITIDDDILYSNIALETLLKYHVQFPKCVIARRAAIITRRQDGTIARYVDWCSTTYGFVGIPRMDIAATTGGMTLFLPWLFNSEIFNVNVFMEKCPYADDLWIKIMEVYSGIPTVLAEKKWEDPVLKEHQKDCLFENYNKDGGNDKQLKELLKEYPRTAHKKDLKNSIFKDGCVTCDEARKIEQEEMDNILEEFSSRVQQYEELLIYGAGDVGSRIYNLLEDKINIKAFVVKDTLDNINKIGNVEVRSYKEFINSGEKILIGLFSDNTTDEVCLNLIKEGINPTRLIVMDSNEKKALMERVYPIFDSGKYWEERYERGENSGAGSYNRLAEFKAEVINKFVRENNIKKVIEWGCGDGNQLQLAEYPTYIGLDVSKESVKICNEKFSGDITKKFIWCGDESFKNEYKGELGISLDVIYHLVEDDVYEEYMERLFSSSERYICIYSSNFEMRSAVHVRNRKFTDWIDVHTNKTWKLLEIVRNKYPYSEDDPNDTSWCDFYFYEKIIM